MAKILKTTGDVLLETGIVPDSSSFAFTVDEQTHIKKYRTLDKHGKKVVDIVLKEEVERIEELNIQKEFMHKGTENEEEYVKFPL